MHAKYRTKKTRALPCWVARLGLALVPFSGGPLLDAGAEARAQLPPGLELDGALIGDIVGVVSGGRERAWVGLYNVDVQLSLQGDAVGWNGGQAFIYILGNGGDDPSRMVGDFQAVNNIAAPDTWKLFEAWLDQALWDGTASIRAGLYDLNSEFDVLESGATLLNSSFGIGPDLSQSGLTGPSIFPTTSLTARVEVRPGQGLLLRGAVLDGVSGDPDDPEGTQVILDEADGLLLAGEVEWRGLGRRVALGGWTYTRSFHSNRAHMAVPGFEDEEGRSFGGYLLAETRVGEREDPTEGLWTFARAGFASGRVNRIGSYFGGGISYRGLLRGSITDELALGIAAARNSDEFMEARQAVGAASERWEIALEATYALRATPWLTLQPDFQLVLNPGTDPAVSDAVLAGVRVILER